MSSNSEDSEPSPAVSAYQCNCQDYESAISPGAYLAELLDYVTGTGEGAGHVVDRWETDEDERTMSLAEFANTFHQPFDRLSATSEAARTDVRHVRITLESLLHYVADHEDGAVPDYEATADYRLSAYETLLGEWGVTREDLRDARYTETDREWVAESIGVPQDRVADLRLRPDAGKHDADALSEENLEDVFGLPALTGSYGSEQRVLDPLRTIEEPLIRQWRETYLRETWRGEDYPDDDYAFRFDETADGAVSLGTETTRPVVDPDLIGPDDIRPADTDREIGESDPDPARPTDRTAYALWVKRRVWLDRQLFALYQRTPAGSSSGGDVPGLLNAMLDPLTYPTNDGGTEHRRTWYVAGEAGTDEERRIDADEVPGSVDDSTVRLSPLADRGYLDDFRLLYRMLTADGSGGKQAARERLGTKYGSDDGDEGRDPESVAGEAIGEYLRLPEEAFVRLVDLLVRHFDGESLEDEEWWEVASILAGARKRRLFEVWIGEEATEDVSLDRKQFWRSQRDPKAGEWSYRRDRHTLPTEFGGDSGLAGISGLSDEGLALGTILERTGDAADSGEYTAGALADVYESAGAGDHPLAPVLATVYGVESPWLWHGSRGWGSYLRTLASERAPGIEPTRLRDQRADRLDLERDEVEHLLQAWSRVASARAGPPAHDEMERVFRLLASTDPAGNLTESDLETAYSDAVSSGRPQNPLLAVFDAVYDVETPWLWWPDNGWGQYLLAALAERDGDADDRPSLRPDEDLRGRLTMDAETLEAVVRAWRRSAPATGTRPDPDELSGAFETLAAVWREREGVELSGAETETVAYLSAADYEPFVDPGRMGRSDLPEEPFGRPAQLLYEKRQRDLRTERDRLTRLYQRKRRALERTVESYFETYDTTRSDLERRLNGLAPDEDVPSDLQRASPLDPILDEVYPSVSVGDSWETHLNDVAVDLESDDSSANQRGEAALDALSLRREEFATLRRVRASAKPTSAESGPDRRALADLFGTLPTGNPLDPVLSSVYDTLTVDGGWRALFEDARRKLRGGEQNPAELDTLSLSPAAFEEVLGLRERSIPGPDRERPPESVVADTIETLTAVWKRIEKYDRSVAGNWIDAERNGTWVDDVETLEDPDRTDYQIRHYWQAYKARRPRWRATQEARSEWQRALLDRSTSPVVDPDLLRHVDDIEEPGWEQPAFDLWTDRTELLFADDRPAIVGPIEDLRDAARNDRSVSEATVRAKFDDALSSVVGVSVDTLRSIGDRIADGEDLSIRVARLDLSTAALSYLLDIEGNVGTKPITAEEWENVRQILLSVWKRRQIGRWRREEAEHGVVLEPAQFDLPGPDDDREPPDDDDPRRWRVDWSLRGDWEDVLESRTEQLEGVDDAIRSAVAAAETEAMPVLRDHLIEVAPGPPDDVSTGERAEWLSERLLIDVEMYSGRETTRVSQAITSIQTLIHTLDQRVSDRAGGLADVTLEIDDDHFDERWHWLGTYARWKAAMGVYLYPQNVLMPTLRRHKSSVLESLMSGSGGSDSLSPAGATAAMDEYRQYFEDVSGLIPEAGCMLPADPVQVDEQRESPYAFALARAKGTDRFYYNVVDVEADTTSLPAHSPRLWTDLSIDGIGSVEDVVGAACYEESVYLFATAEKEGNSDSNDGDDDSAAGRETLLKYATYDVAADRWDDFQEIDVPKKARVRRTEVDSVKLGEIQTANVVRTEGWDAPPEVHLTVEDAGFEGINESVAEDEAELTWKFSRLGNGRHLFVQFDEGGNPPDKESLENSNPVGLANTEMLYNMPAVLRHGDKRLCISSLHYEVLDLSQTGIARQDTFEKYEDSVYIGTFQDLLDSSQYAFVVENVVYQPYSDHVLLTTQRNNAILIERDMSGGLTVDWFVGREGYAKIGFEDGVFGTGIQCNNVVEHEDNTDVSDWRSHELLLNRAEISDPPDISTVRIDYSEYGEYPTVSLSERQLLSPTGVDAESDPWAFGPNPGELTDGDFDRTALFHRFLVHQVIDDAFAGWITTEYHREANYLLPLFLARQLSTAGEYDAALDWFRTVYDYTANIDHARYDTFSSVGPAQPNVWPPLRPGDGSDVSAPSIEWLVDPMNPHSVAETRAGAHLTFVLFSIVQCLNDAADDAFAEDTARSVANATGLYEQALDLLEREPLTGEETPCESVWSRLERVIDNHVFEDELWTEYPDLTRAGVELRIEDMKSDVESIDAYTTREEAVTEIQVALGSGDLREALDIANEYAEADSEGPTYEERLAEPEDIGYEDIWATDEIARRVINTGIRVDDVVASWYGQAESDESDGDDTSDGAFEGVDTSGGQDGSVVDGDAWTAGTGAGPVVEGDLSWIDAEIATGDRSAATAEPVETVDTERVEVDTSDTDDGGDESGADDGGDESGADDTGATISPTNLDYVALTSFAAATTSSEDDGDDSTETTSDGGTVAPVAAGATMDVLNPTRHRFCVPENPYLESLRRHAQLSLEKIRTGRNIAGMKRDLDPYASDVSVESAAPTPDSGVGLPGGGSAQPTNYRYETLLQRARQLADRARQFETQFFQAVEKRVGEERRLTQARQQVELANERVTLQESRVARAEEKVELARLQRARSWLKVNRYKQWIENPLVKPEKKARNHLHTAMIFQYTAAGLQAVAGTLRTISYAKSGAGLKATAEAMSTAARVSSTTASALSTQAQIFQIDARKERRKRRWRLQRDVAKQNAKIGDQRVTLARDSVRIARQEREIADLRAEHAEDIVNFHRNKFTNEELYQWMSEVLERVYRYFLQQAASIARLAQRQLAFERQEMPRQFIGADYWNVSKDGQSTLPSGSDGDGTDRRGLTGSAQLLRDITELDQHEFETDERKLQVEKTISVSNLDSMALQQFRETGVLSFATTLEQFDRDHPGQYLRLIEDVEVTVVALTPPTAGINATLRSSGNSRVVVGDTLYREKTISRDPEEIVLNYAREREDGVELRPRESEEMLRPFENSGVATDWELRMPKAANDMDYDTIADVQLTLTYSAFESYDYRKQVEERLSPERTVERSFHFKSDFADAWYDLVNDGDGQSTTVSFETDRDDFPANVGDLEVDTVSLYLVGPTDPDEREEFKDLTVALEGENGSKKEEAATEGLVEITSAFSGESPAQEWTLTVTPDSGGVGADPFTDGTVEDVMLIVTAEGRTPEWPA